MTLVAIHQPNFFPWLGWFDKLARADRFILLDTVQVQLTGGNYTNRTRILAQGQPLWLTMPLRRGRDARETIALAPIAEDGRWRRKLLATLRQAYARAPHFGEAMDLLDPLVGNPASNLLAYNVAALDRLAGVLGLATAKFVRAADVPGEGNATDLLVSLVRSAGGTAYLTGGGAAYQDDAAFAAAGIRIVRQDFRPRPYPQAGTSAFVPGLSVIDALMNLGIDGTARLLAPASAEAGA